MSSSTTHSRRTARAFAAILAASALGLSACSSSSGGSDDPIRIGGTLGLTGSLAAPSAEYQAIYKLWAKDINQHGGLLGRKVELDIKNDNSTAATAATQYQGLLTKDRVDLVLAPYATFVGAAVVPIVKSSGKVLFNGGFTDTGLNKSAGGDMITTYPYQPQDYSRSVFDALGKLPTGQRPKTVGILTNNNPFTLTVRDGYEGDGGVRAFAKKAGMKVVFDETYAGDTADFTGVVNKAKSSGADLFFVVGLPEDSDTILKTMKTVGYRPQLACACGSQVITLPNWADLGSATDDVVGSTGSWPSQGYDGSDVLQKYADAHGEKVVPAYAQTAYASLQVLQQAVEGAGTVDQDKLRDYLHAHTFDTVIGPMTFDKDGVPDYRQVLLQSRDGKVQPVWPADVAAGSLQVDGN